METWAKALIITTVIIIIVTIVAVILWWVLIIVPSLDSSPGGFGFFLPVAGVVETLLSP